MRAGAVDQIWRAHHRADLRGHGHPALRRQPGFRRRHDQARDRQGLQRLLPRCDPHRPEAACVMMKREECLKALARHITDEVVVATYSSAAEWNEINPRPLNYFSMGAMGLASSHALGLALANPKRRIVVLDGDGSLLMNLGSLVTIGAAAPKNLVHFVSKNSTYEANGGHPIPNQKADFSGLARSAGYAHTFDFNE